MWRRHASPRRGAEPLAPRSRPPCRTLRAPPAGPQEYEDKLAADLVASRRCSEPFVSVFVHGGHTTFRGTFGLRFRGRGADAMLAKLKAEARRRPQSGFLPRGVPFRPAGLRAGPGWRASAASQPVRATRNNPSQPEPQVLARVGGVLATTKLSYGDGYVEQAGPKTSPAGRDPPHITHYIPPQQASLARSDPQPCATGRRRRRCGRCWWIWTPGSAPIRSTGQCSRRIRR